MVDSVLKLADFGSQAGRFRAIFDRGFPRNVRIWTGIDRNRGPSSLKSGADAADFGQCRGPMLERSGLHSEKLHGARPAATVDQRGAHPALLPDSAGLYCSKATRAGGEPAGPALRARPRAGPGRRSRSRGSPRGSAPGRRGAPASRAPRCASRAGGQASGEGRSGARVAPDFVCRGSPKRPRGSTALSSAE